MSELVLCLLYRRLRGSAADRRYRHALGLRSAGGWRPGRWSFEILGELSQVLGGGDEQNLVAGAAQAPQPQPVELQDALQVGEQHLDALAVMARLLECLGLGERASYVTGAIVPMDGGSSPVL